MAITDTHMLLGRPLLRSRVAFALTPLPITFFVSPFVVPMFGGWRSRLARDAGGRGVPKRHQHRQLAKDRAGERENRGKRDASNAQVKREEEKRESRHKKGLWLGVTAVFAAACIGVNSSAGLHRKHITALGCQTRKTRRTGSSPPTLAMGSTVLDRGDATACRSPIRFFAAHLLHIPTKPARQFLESRARRQEQGGSPPFPAVSTKLAWALSMATFAAVA